jgi:ribonuclease R
VPFVTIDGADARDFDDAVFAEPEGDGFTLMVAIADVGWYVRPGSALDRAALERGNSVYFPDRVVPMLPERLSNDLCSLRPDEDKAAMVCTITIDAHGRKRGHRFERALIRSAARLTYDSAQAIKDHGRHAESGQGGVPQEVVALVQRLYDGWAALTRARRAPAARSTRRSASPDEHDGTVSGVVPPSARQPPPDPGFMVAANVAAAGNSRLSLPALSRVHDPPDPVKVAALAAMLGPSAALLAKARCDAGTFQPRARMGGGDAVGAHGPATRCCAAGRSRSTARRSRPFRPFAAALRPLHLADPPLRRPGGPRADPGRSSGPGPERGRRGRPRLSWITSPRPSASRRGRARRATA